MKLTGWAGVGGGEVTETEQYAIRLLSREMA